MRSITCLSLAAVLLSAASLHAQSMAPTGDRILSDPAYLPLHGQIYGETGYGYSQTDGTLFDSTGGQLAGTRNILNDVNQTVAYGITDDLSLRAGLTYGFGSDHRFTGAGKTDTDRYGFENPTFGATYRIIDERSHPVSLDIFADGAPDVFAAHGAGLNGHSTVASGAGEADFGVALARETNVFTLRGAFTDKYLGGGSTSNPATGFSTDTTSYWVQTLSLQSQARFTPRLSVNVDYAYNFQGAPTVLNTGNGIAYVNHLGDTQGLGAALNFAVVPGRLVASTNYQHTFYGDRHETFALATDDVTQTRAGDFYGVSLRYLFR